jgi:DNA-binding FadR family transcriptional regulator
LPAEDSLIDRFAVSRTTTRTVIQNVARARDYSSDMGRG